MHLLGSPRRSRRARWTLLLMTVCVMMDGSRPAMTSPVEVRGAGASFPSEVYGAWIRAYTQRRSQHVSLYMDYESASSAVGKARIKGERPPGVHFAGSDSPLTEQEAAQYPHLRSIPTLVGAIVIAYNLPGIDQLVLSLEAVTGVYNGSITTWNHPIISALNPGLSLPDVQIVVISRSDKSGTTEAFTTGMSMYSPAWNTTYGTFSDGLTDDGVPVKWNESVIKFFGHTNRGMNGMVVSLRYSVGYMSIGDVKALDMPYAALKNRDGNVVTVEMASLQSALIQANGSFQLMNLPGPDTYPLVTYTYFLVNLNYMTNCSSIVELLRFMQWFYHSDAAKNDAMRFNFTPLDDWTVDSVEMPILRNMTCNGENVWTLMVNQMIQEARVPVDDTWTLPLSITTAVLIAIILTMAAISAHQQWTIRRQLMRGSWMISPQILDNHGEEARNITRMKGDVFGDDLDVKQPESSIFSSKSGTNAFILGIFDEHVVSMVRMCRDDLRLTTKQKRMIIKLKDIVKHTNVMKLMGVSSIRSALYICYLGQITATLKDFLNDSKIKIRENGNMAIVKEIISGIKYLHRKGIIHGNLKATHIVIDSFWTIKIVAWVENHIATQDVSRDGNRVQPLNISNTYKTNDKEKDYLWQAPETLMYNRRPTYKSDMYSFGMVLQEIFSRKDPYQEVELPVSQILDAVLTGFLVPQIHPDTPYVLSALMEKCWQLDPTGRPSINSAEHMLQNNYPDNTPLLDTMIESMKEYARGLEKELADSQKEASAYKMKLGAHLTHSLPICLSQKMTEGLPVDAMMHDEASAMVLTILNLDHIITHLGPKDFIDLLQTFYDKIDGIRIEEDVCRVSRFVPMDIYVSGVPKSASRHAIAISQCALRIKDAVGEMRRDRTQVEDVGDITVAMGMASGPMISGVLGKAVAQLVIVGQPVIEAIHLLGKTQPGTIQMTEQCFALIKDVPFLHTSAQLTKQGLVYSLEGTNE